MLWGGYSMDRLEIRHIHPASIPGMVPMALGFLFVICGAMLFISSNNEPLANTVEWGIPRKLIWTAVLCLIFSILLVGIIPFYLATFLFISAFSGVFTWIPTASTKQKALKIFYALLMGGIFSGLISALFRYAFLIRLP